MSSVDEFVRALDADFFECKDSLENAFHDGYFFFVPSRLVWENWEELIIFE